MLNYIIKNRTKTLQKPEIRLLNDFVFLNFLNIAFTAQFYNLELVDIVVWWFPIFVGERCPDTARGRIKRQYDVGLRAGRVYKNVVSR